MQQDKQLLNGIPSQPARALTLSLRKPFCNRSISHYCAGFGKQVRDTLIAAAHPTLHSKLADFEPDQDRADGRHASYPQDLNRPELSRLLDHSKSLYNRAITTLIIFNTNSTRHSTPLELIQLPVPSSFC